MANIINNNGLIVVDARPPYDNRINSIAIKPDGSTVVFGTAQQFSGSNKDGYILQLNPDMTLDTNYSDNGTLFIDPSYIGWSSGAPGAARWSDDWLSDSFLQQDGSVISVGHYIPTGDPETRLFVSRTNENGTSDSSFAADGIYTLAFGGHVYGWEVLKASADSILILGDTVRQYTGWNSSGRTFLLSLNSVGELNSNSFTNGMLLFNIGGGRFQSGVVQPDGKIIIVGTEVPINNELQSRLIIARLNTDGSLDASFSNDGYDIKGIGEHASASDVFLQSDGKILVIGSSYTGGTSSDFLIVRYNSNGSLDNSFSGDGIVTTDFFGDADRATSIAIQSDGKILVAGYTTYPDSNIYPDPGAVFSSNIDFALARYTADGRLDSTFSIDGKVSTDFGSHSDSANGIYIQNDGKIVLSGETYIWNADSDTAGNHFAGALARYNIDGSIDSQFGLPVDNLPPALVSITPSDEATNVAVSSNIIVTFSEAIVRGIGNIVLKSSTGTVIATYDAATSSNIATFGSALTLNPSADLAASTGYKVEFSAGSIKDLAGNSYAGTTSYNFTTGSGPVVFGTPNNDILTGGAGVSIDGLAGIDTVSYSGNRGSISHNPNGTWTVGTDTLTSIERLQFTDKKVALDITHDGNAGKALEFIGMLAFNKVTDKAIVGEIISYFDQLPSMHDICQLAINGGLTRALAGSDSNAALAQLVFRNVVGHAATAGDVDSLISYMDGRNASMSQTDFLTAIAGLELNQQHIGLVGLQSTGVEYIAYNG